ncbi:hypothetical protein D3C75_1265950 [compost metagenome]
MKKELAYRIKKMINKNTTSEAMPTPVWKLARFWSASIISLLYIRDVNVNCMMTPVIIENR